jgi:DNA-directed RNA polymerase II subunit RPB1
MVDMEIHQYDHFSFRLPVPPPPVRPSIVMDSVSRGEDDLTHKLAEIVKFNTYLSKQERSGAPSHIIQEYQSLLQFHVATLMNNEIPGQPQVLIKAIL